MDIRRLTDSLEAISDGFALFDPEERLVLVNSRFREFCGVSAPLMVPGVSYEELLRASVEEEVVPGGTPLALEAYVQDRLFRFRYPSEPFEFQTGDGRWILVHDHKTPDGSTACVRTDITELKRRETDLRDSEGRYRQLVDLSPDGIAVHDSRGVGRFLNAAGRRILGLPAGADPTELTVLAFATEESRPLAEAMMRRVVQGGETISQIRIRLCRADAQEITVEVSAVPFQSAGERLVLCLFRDISGEAAASLRLRESEVRARSILDTALDAIVSIDGDGNILEFNPAAERMFGWKRNEVLGRPMAEVLVPDHHRANHTAGMERLKAGGRPRVLGRRVEVEGVRRDGTVFPVELAITEVPLGPGRRFTAYIRDITEQKQTEREIADKTRILEAMMESVGVGIEVFDAGGKLLIANQRLSEVLDLPQHLLKPGTHDRDVLRYLAEHGEYPDETVEQTIAGYDGIRASGEFFAERRRPNGRWLQVRHFPMPGGGYVGLFTDVTDQKNLEAQLLQSQKMDALGQLAGGVAHDFNNILSVIGGYASLAQTLLPANSPVLPHLAKITQGVQRASALTRELLTFSRRKVTHARTVDLAAVVRNQEFLLKPLLGELVALTLEVPAQPVWVSIDPDMAAQALVNLAINARDAMPHGGPLTIRLELPEQAGPADHRPADLGTCPHAVLRVSDGGTGMPPDVVARIFEPFYTTKPPGQGTGLGLAMVYGTMRQCGGAVDVETAPGQGTTFRLWFPMAAAPTSPAEAATVPDPAARLNGPATILVAEDEPDLLALVRDTLLAEGHEVMTAADGVEALEVFEQGGIDLLLTDLVMPELGGARLAQLVAELDPEVAVLFMTGYPSRGQYAAADLPSDATIIYKPIDLGELKAAVAGALARRHQCMAAAG